jgi:hypothetical protein
VPPVARRPPTKHKMLCHAPSSSGLFWPATIRLRPVVMAGYYAHPCIIICESHTQVFLGNFESFLDVANLDALMLAYRPADVPDRLLSAVPDLN